MTRQRALGFFVLGICLTLTVQALPPDLKSEHDPVKRSERALTVADEDFESARNAYGEGAVQKGDAQLEEMTNALNECVASLQITHKSKLYKKPELRVALLQRRMQTLLEDIGVEQRGWAEYTLRKLNEIHDKLLAGALGK